MSGMKVRVAIQCAPQTNARQTHRHQLRLQRQLQPRQFQPQRLEKCSTVHNAAIMALGMTSAIVGIAGVLAVAVSLVAKIRARLPWAQSASKHLHAVSARLMDMTMIIAVVDIVVASVAAVSLVDMTPVSNHWAPSAPSAVWQSEPLTASFFLVLATKTF